MINYRCRTVGVAMVTQQLLVCSPGGGRLLVNQWGSEISGAWGNQTRWDCVDTRQRFVVCAERISRDCFQQRHGLLSRVELPRIPQGRRLRVRSQAAAGTYLTEFNWIATPSPNCVGNPGWHRTRKPMAYRVSCYTHSPHLNIPRSFNIVIYLILEHYLH